MSRCLVIDRGPGSMVRRAGLHLSDSSRRSLTRTQARATATRSRRRLIPLAGASGWRASPCVEPRPIEGLVRRPLGWITTLGLVPAIRLKRRRQRGQPRLARGVGSSPLACALGWLAVERHPALNHARLSERPLTKTPTEVRVAPIIPPTCCNCKRHNRIARINRFVKRCNDSAADTPQSLFVQQDTAFCPDMPIIPPTRHNIMLFHEIRYFIRICRLYRRHAQR